MAFSEVLTTLTHDLPIEVATLPNEAGGRHLGTTHNVVRTGEPSSNFRRHGQSGGDKFPMPLLIAYEQTKWMENRHDDVQDAPINGDNNKNVEIESKIGGRNPTKLSDKALNTDCEESSRGTGTTQDPRQGSQILPLQCGAFQDPFGK